MSFDADAFQNDAFQVASVLPEIEVISFGLYIDRQRDLDIYIDRQIEFDIEL